MASIHWQNVKVKNADGENVNRQNIKRKKAEFYKMENRKKHWLWQKLEEKNVD
jgi:hypothetical protein